MHHLSFFFPILFLITFIVNFFSWFFRLSFCPMLCLSLFCFLIDTLDSKVCFFLLMVLLFCSHHSFRFLIVSLMTLIDDFLLVFFLPLQNSPFLLFCVFFPANKKPMPSPNQFAANHIWVIDWRWLCFLFPLVSIIHKSNKNHPRIQFFIKTSHIIESNPFSFLFLSFVHFHTGPFQCTTISFPHHHQKTESRLNLKRS